jgi:hypothetical protein
MNDRDEAVLFYNSLEGPLLILSSRVGRGNTSIAEAILEYFDPGAAVQHRSIEDFMPARIVNEDLVRYKFISNHFPFLLSAIYTVPMFYQRKLLREKLRSTRLAALTEFIRVNRIRTVVCVSHRQAFWTAVAKRNESLDVALYGVLTEFGNNLGWKYLFWEKMNGFISPVLASDLRMGIPAGLPFKQLALPARSSFYSLPRPGAAQKRCLLIGGFFGQGRLVATLRILRRRFPAAPVSVVCGDNAALEKKLRIEFGHAAGVEIHGLLDSIEPLVSRCHCVITKPGMSTLLEAHASRRKIFLFKGMPIAESNNARYAIKHFGAQWFSEDSFSKWLGTGSD